MQIIPRVRQAGSLGAGLRGGWRTGCRWRVQMDTSLGKQEEHFVIKLGKHRKKDFEVHIKEINLTSLS